MPGTDTRPPDLPPLKPSGTAPWGSAAGATGDGAVPDVVALEPNVMSDDAKPSSPVKLGMCCAFVTKEYGSTTSPGLVDQLPPQVVPPMS